MYNENLFKWLRHLHYQPGIVPASVVTRSVKAEKEEIKEQGKEEIGLSDTFLQHVEGKYEERKKENQSFLDKID